MRLDLSSLLPAGKHDTAKAEAIVTLGYPEVEPILPSLLEWVQDLNWPVASVLCPFLASIGTPLAPHIRRILQTNDDTWKYSLLAGIVAESAPLADELSSELQRLVSFPTAGEREEELNIHAHEIIMRHGSEDA
ncbi:MAG: DUF5071 domain-containing protein [Methyloversatilis discipulorum]|uniref:DUF5071 domain-containing protein n=1 Tax=Methyloversatilis discipulorum TaxID=1119528 RepID=UPI0026EAEB1E|nr:DUF5071 domain-containing protein [Methyloversatilis discipulorum]MBT9518713.1 DUF5071 domain-containing protein [Methyloversatilis discipulorum]